MKAEHRKELETNALADRMGRVVQGMKQAPQKRTLLWVVLGCIVVGGIWLYFRKGAVAQIENSQRWVEFDDGAGPYLQNLVQVSPQTPQAKAAKYELNYRQLREALSFLPRNPIKTLTHLEGIDKNYQEMAQECKDDKVLLPEALYAQAVIAETRIIKEDDNWKAALEAYKTVAENHKDSAVGKLARKRIEVLQNQDKRDDLLKVYRDLRIEFVREDRVPALPPGLPPDHPPIPGMPGIPK